MITASGVFVSNEKKSLLEYLKENVYKGEGLIEKKEVAR